MQNELQVQQMSLNKLEWFNPFNAKAKQQIMSVQGQAVFGKYMVHHKKCIYLCSRHQHSDERKLA